jgi:hypothetical protein
MQHGKSRIALLKQSFSAVIVSKPVPGLKEKVHFEFISKR